MTMPSIWTEKGCTQNADCVTPLATGDSYEAKVQCISNPSNYVEALGQGGAMLTTILPF
jgi:hypothetical protein